MRKLTKLITEGLHWDMNATYQVWADSPTKELKEQETLAQAGIWDGACLTLQPQSMGTPPASSTRKQRATSASSKPAVDGPVTGWRDILNDTNKSEHHAEQEKSDNSSDYDWIQLD
jgi:hypothetical protein